MALRGRPMSLGSMSPHVHAASDPDSFRQWIDTQFDRSVTWTDIEWLREKWKGRLLLKGILDGADAERAVAVGTDGIVVSNHGGRQLDGVASTATKLPGNRFHREQSGRGAGRTVVSAAASTSSAPWPWAPMVC